MAARWTWKDAPELMARLSAAQNHPANVNIDIQTFAGLCENAAELLRHVERYEAKAASYIAPQRRRKAA